MSDHRCITGGPDCPGNHPNDREVCVSARQTPYQRQAEAMIKRHALQRLDLRIRQTGELIALARQFNEDDEFSAATARHRDLMQRRSEFH